MIEQDIHKIISKIVKEFNPQKVVLFGSYAWGSPKKNSDIDLFIVKDDAKKNTREMAIDIDGMLLPRTFPIDIIVCKPAQVEESLKDKNMFITKIITKGKTLYDQRVL